MNTNHVHWPYQGATFNSSFHVFKVVYRISSYPIKVSKHGYYNYKLKCFLRVVCFHLQLYQVVGATVAVCQLLITVCCPAILTCAFGRSTEEPKRPSG